MMRRKEGNSGKQGVKQRNSSLELLRIVSMIWYCAFILILI